MLSQGARSAQFDCDSDGEVGIDVDRNADIAIDSAIAIDIDIGEDPAPSGRAAL